MLQTVAPTIIDDIPCAICFSLGTCGQDAPHVFVTKIAPPPYDTRCECGAVTWGESVMMAREKLAQVTP